MGEGRGSQRATLPDLPLGVKFVLVQGLRERKKAATRQAISDIATRMFEARGFEQVTVAEIANAAGVSIKTVFNYFGSKEELFYDREDELLEALLTALRDRPPGTTPTQALRPLLLNGPLLGVVGCRWSDLDGRLYDDMRGFIATERASPALSARRLSTGWSWVKPLTEVSGSAAWAAMVVGILFLRQ